MEGETGVDCAPGAFTSIAGRTSGLRLILCIVHEMLSRRPSLALTLRRGDRRLALGAFIRSGRHVVGCSPGPAGCLVELLDDEPLDTIYRATVRQSRERPTGEQRCPTPAVLKPSPDALRHGRLGALGARAVMLLMCALRRLTPSEGVEERRHLGLTRGSEPRRVDRLASKWEREERRGEEAKE